MLVDRRTVLLGLGAAGAAPSALSSPVSAREGYARVEGGRIWWRSVGGGSRTPLLTLHGGPGAGHDYLTPLEALADQRRVVLYDQLGCGRSSPLPKCNMPQLDFFRRPPRPWNTGRIIGAKLPFKPKHVWAIRQQLKANFRARGATYLDLKVEADNPEGVDRLYRRIGMEPVG